MRLAMFLIFGFRLRFRTTGTVAFFCPRCGGDRHGDHKAARRWFTLFWIPVIPLNQAGEILECTTCHTRYDPAVTDQPTTAALGQVLSNAVRVLTAMIAHTGDRNDPDLRAAALTDIRSVVDGYDDLTLAADIEAVDPAQAEQYVAPLAHGLQVGGKERLLGDLTRVALAARTVTDDQRRVIDLAGRGLGLTPAHITGIVSSVAAASTPPAGEPPAVEPPIDG